MKPEHPETIHEKNAYVSGKIVEFNAVISFAVTALKTAILINGGAGIAILALAGKIWGDKNIVSYLAVSLLLFTFGVLAAAVGTGMSYLSQNGFLMAEKKEDYEKPEKFQRASIYCIIASYTLFALGSLWAGFVLSILIRI
jgi:hypothetical protein